MKQWNSDIFSGNILTLASTIINNFNTLYATDNPYPYTTDVDIDFYINHLRNTYLSPIADYYIDELQVNQTQFQTNIVALFNSKFHDKYKQLFTIYNTDYNPIENYNMLETSKEITGSMYSNANSGSGGVYAFNSSSLSDTDATSQSGSGRTDGGTDRTLNRSGNIGVTTTQQMIDSTLDLYAKYNLVSYIYNDLIEILSLTIF